MKSLSNLHWLDSAIAQVSHTEPSHQIGKVLEASGTTVRITGLTAPIGSQCSIQSKDGSFELQAEVVAVTGSELLLTPLGPLQGVRTKMDVVLLSHKAQFTVGNYLIGRVIDANGNPLDGKPMEATGSLVNLYNDPPNPLLRKPINDVFETGVKAIDSALTMGIGQRMGIFASAGGGKSTLLGMFARTAKADLNVIVLVGERGREVGEFIEESLGVEGMKKSILIVATAEKSALERCKAVYVAHAIAEHFRDTGSHVLLMADSITRFARALRDVGLAVNEPPVRRGFTPSVFSTLPRLFERAGNSDTGYLTAIYTVLVEDEQAGEDPVVEEVRSLLDGHIVLSRALASAAHYPAIDVLNSASRVFAGYKRRTPKTCQ